MVLHYAINYKYSAVKFNQRTVDELGSRLQSYRIFEHYQDRFVALLGKIR